VRFLAEFIMRGRMQAALVVAGAAAVPMLFLLSVAASSLVLLRRGLADGLHVLAWGLLPALIWWFYDDPRTLLVLLGTTGLALLLRSTSSWRTVMLGSVGLGGLYAALLLVIFREPIALMAAELHKLLPEALPGTWEKMSAVEQMHLKAMFSFALTGLMAALLQILSLVGLMVGRYWQALLYNPGGFGEEFRALRLSPVLAFSLVAVALLGPALVADLAILTPVCSVPLIFASLALMHGLVAQGRMAKFWLVGLYVTMVLLLQFIYPLLAILAVVDSLCDFRGRASRT